MRPIAFFGGESRETGLGEEEGGADLAAEPVQDQAEGIRGRIAL